MQQDAVTSGRILLDYIVVDGGSTDGSVERLIEYTKGRQDVRIVSERDMGMYDALAKGFRLAVGDITCYLNAGDLWTPWCLDTVTAIFDTFAEVSWITGYDGYYNSDGAMIATRWPPRYTRRLITRGVYGPLLPAIQQETTFWRSSLVDLLDFKQLASYRLAGDAYLWRTFAKTTRLMMVRAVLGGFRYHGGHLSDDKSAVFTNSTQSAARRG